MDTLHTENEHTALSNLLKEKSCNNMSRKMKPSDAAFLLRKRYWVCFLASLGMLSQMLLRTNLSIALVEMTSEKKFQLNNETIIQKAEFDWDSKMKGFILSVFSIGYICGPLGGLLALKFGATTIFGLAIALTAALTILTPFLVRLHISAYLAVRFLEGLFESFIVPTNVAMFILWALPKERSRLSTIGGVGAYFGAAINYPLSGFLAHKYGWESIFYVTGGLTLIWSAIWFIFVSNDPTKDRLMTQKERDYFKMHISEKFIEKKKFDVPWKTIAKSKPVWAMLNEYFSFYWAQSFLLYCLPLYIKDLYNVDIQNIGLISGIPAIAAFIGNSSASFLSDYMRNHTSLSQPLLHRIFVATGQISFVIGLIYCGLWANFEQSIISLSLARLLAGTTEMSYRILPIDMFSEFAGLMRGFGVSATSVSYFLNPIVMGFMVADHSRSSWNLYFLFLSVFNIWSLVIYYIYGSGKLQDWATQSAKNENYEDKSDVDLKTVSI